MESNELNDIAGTIGEESLKQIFEAIPTPVVYARLDGPVVFRSAEFRGLFGYTDEDVPDEEAWWSLAYPDEHYRETARTAWRGAISSALHENRKVEPQESLVTCKDGSVKNIEFLTAIIGDWLLVIFRDVTEQRKIEQQLRFTQYVVDSMSDFAYWINPEGCFVYVNDAALRHLGYSREEFLRMCVWDANPDHPPEVWKSHWQELRQNKRLNFEARIKAKDGRIVPLDMTANYVEFGGKEFNCAIGRDIGERKRAERELRLSHELIETMSDMAFWITEDARFIYANQAASDILGYTKEEILNLTVPDVNPEFPMDAWPAEWEDSRIKRRKTIETVNKARDGRIIPVEVSVNYVEIEGQGVSCVITRDITERKRADEELKLTQFSVDHAADAMFLVLPDARFQYANEAASRNLGYSREELLSMTVLDIEPGMTAGKWTEHWQDTIREGSVILETRHRAKDGREFPVEVVADYVEYNDKQYITASVRDITQRKQIEETARREKALADALIDSAPGLIYMFDEQGRYARWNKRVEQLGGYSSSEISQMTVADWPWTADSKERLLTEAGRVFTTGYGEVEASFRAVDGSIKTYYFTGLRMVQDDKPYLVGIAVDITERKQAEEAARKETALIQAIFDSVPGVLYLFNEEGHFVRWNKGLEGIVLFPPEEIAHVLAMDLPWTDESRPVVEKAVKRAFDEGYVDQEATLLTPQGFRTFRFTGLRLIIDDAPHVVGMGLDITERKRVLEELALTNAELIIVNRLISETAGLADLQSILDMAADEALKIVGLEGSTVCLIEPDDVFKLAAHRATSDATIAEIEEGVIRVGECLCGMCAKTGEPLILSTKEEVLDFATRESQRGDDIRFHAAFPLMVESKCVGVLCVFTRTEKKPSERSLKLLETASKQIAIAIERAKLFQEVKRNAEELEQRVLDRTAQLETANKELEAFSYSVSHDLRAPLRAIDGFSLVILEDYSDRLDDEGKGYLSRIRAAAVRMGILIDDILRLSRVTRAEMVRTNVNLSDLAASIASDLVESQPERRVDFVIQPDMTVDADANLMRIMLENLIGNAWKFSSKQEVARIEVGVTGEEDKAIYFVRDNGVGFDPAYAGKLFVAFQRLHTEAEFAGTGIGLTTVKRIVNRHGGEVWATGELGKGATIYFTLGGEQ